MPSVTLTVVSEARSSGCSAEEIKNSRIGADVSVAGQLNRAGVEIERADVTHPVVKSLVAVESNRAAVEVDDAVDRDVQLGSNIYQAAVTDVENRAIALPADP
jgi:hypothetical protein